MTVFPLRLTDGCLFIDNSSMSLITACLRKSAYGLSLAKKQARDETALRFGGIMHKALEARYMHGTKVTPAIEQEMIKTLQAEFISWQPPEGDFRNLDQAVSCVTAYNKRYPDEDYDIVEVNGHRGTETPFAVPLTELQINDHIWVSNNGAEPSLEFIESLPVFFTGRIDLVIDKPMFGLMLKDHKTTSIGGGQFFTPFYTDFQFKGYCWAVKQLLGLDRYPAGVTINGLINRRPTRTGKSIEFIRDDITFTPDVIDEWKESFISNLWIYIDAILRQDFPMQTQMCTHKYGICEFYDVCKLPLAQRAMMLNSGQYVDRTWDPILQENDKPPAPYMP